MKKRLLILLLLPAIWGGNIAFGQEVNEFSRVIREVEPGMTEIFKSISADDAEATPEGETPKSWKLEGLGGVNMSQVSLTNWSAGGENSVAFDLLFNYSANYEKKKYRWDNRLELAYGLNVTKSKGTRKTNDKIYLASMYGYKVSKTWFVSGFMTFSTQFDDGYDYDKDVIISRFMSPGYLTAGVGMTWTPRTWFKATFSPATWRGTFVNDRALSDAGAFGVKPGEHFLSEFGGSINAEYKQDVMKNVTIFSRLNLFSNYLEKPQNVDVNWDTQATFKINKWFSASLNLILIYDDNMLKKTQFKQALGIGLQAKF